MIPYGFPPFGVALWREVLPWGDVDGWVLYVPGSKHLTWGAYGEDPLGWRP